MEYSLPSYVQYVRLAEDRAVLSGPVTRNELRGQSVPLVDSALPYLREGVTTSELADTLNIDISVAESLLAKLSNTDELQTTRTEDPWTWMSETPTLTRNTVDEACVAVLSTTDTSDPILQSLSTVELTDVSSITEHASSTDYLLTVTVGERPDFHRAVLDETHSANLPWLPTRIVGKDVILGPFFTPDGTTCYNCYYERRVACDRHPEAQLLEFEAREEESSYPPYLDAAWRLLSSTSEIELLADIDNHATPKSKNGVVRYDIQTGKRNRSRLYSLPNCEICAQS